MISLGAIGIVMSEPWHLRRDRFTAAGVIVRSSNYTLYGDISARVMRTLAGFTPDLAVYAARAAERMRRQRLAAENLQVFVQTNRFKPGDPHYAASKVVHLPVAIGNLIKVAHIRLCHSRMLFVRAYPRETQEMVFDAHDRAFALFKGTCGRGIYDNMKTAVETVFVGKDRRYNRRFLQMCSHYLIDPVACTPAAGWKRDRSRIKSALSANASSRRVCGSRIAMN